MDGAGVSHYVAPAALVGERPDLDLVLELLLFLSAMLAGLTGLISGDRAVETRQVERTAVAFSAAVEVGARAAEAGKVASAAYAAPRRTFRATSVAEAAATAEALPQAAPVDERRLE
jgi:hypothetical protein